MRATVQFIRPDRKLALLIELLNIIKAIKDLRQHILEDGILLERLAPAEIESIRNTLTQLGYVKRVVTDHSVRVPIHDRELRALFGLVLPVARKSNDFARVFWERGFTLERLTPDQAEALKQRLDTIAVVTVVPDIPQTHIHTVSGLVSQGDGTPLAASGFTVRAFDTHSTDSPVPCGAAAALQADGFYRIDYAWQSNGREGPDLLVQVFDVHGGLVAEATKTSAAVQEFIDIAAADVCIVHGTVRHAHGFSLAGVIVRAYDRDLRTEVLLGQTETDEGGNYQITYDARKLRPGKSSADLVLRVFESGSGIEAGKKTESGRKTNELAVSDTVFNAPARQTIDIEIDSGKFFGPSEYERYLTELGPLIGEAYIHELTDEDLNFLHGKTGIPFAHLDCLRMDARLSFEHDLPPAAAYGLLRQGLPGTIQRLSTERPSRLREAFAISLAHHLIPTRLGPQQELFIEHLLSCDAPLDSMVFREPDASDIPDEALAFSFETGEGMNEPTQPDEPHEPDELDIKLERKA